MHEILEQLPRGARVLDLGCREGSFPDGAYDVLAIRVDLTLPKTMTGLFVQADAIQLPFRSQTFDAVILNHSVEHFVNLKPALQEIGRVTKRDGAACVTVPDATTFTDRLYRKVFRSCGGHVNLFDSATDLEKTLAWYLGLSHIATRTLYSSLSFLNRRNTRGPVNRKQMRFRGMPEPLLAVTVAGTRIFDRWFGTRTSIYGWAFYFGNIKDPVDVQPSSNVCIRCGQAYPAHELQAAARVKKGLLLRSYTCQNCSATNYFFRDSSHS